MRLVSSGSCGFGLKPCVQSTFESGSLIGMCETLSGGAVDARGQLAICRFGCGGIALLNAAVEAFDRGAHV